ncbi:MAG: hypothetical protein WCA46_15400 [Actinocatenispora sp.]
MRAPRYEQFVKGLIEANQPAAIASVQTFAEAGHTEDPRGVKIGLSTGSAVYLRFNHGSPPAGDNFTAPEKIVEGEAPTPVPQPALEVRGGKVTMVDLEQWLAALIVNSGSAEVRKVTTYSTREKPRSYVLGFNVLWHNGGEAYAAIIHTQPAGRGLRSDLTLAEAV